MKKSNTYLADDEIDVGEIIKILWRQKILILSISIIFGLVGYLYASFSKQDFKSKIIIKNIPKHTFLSYDLGTGNITHNPQNNNHKVNNDNISLADEFDYNFKLNFLSLDNLEIFFEQSRKFDNFKTYLKSRNISIQSYFANNKFAEKKKKDIIFTNEYFLVFQKELDGVTFLNDYAEFIKNKTITEFKKKLKLTIEYNIEMHALALQSAKITNIENPIVAAESRPLFYKGTKILSEDIISLKKLIVRLENDKFNYDYILDRSALVSVDLKNLNTYSIIGIIFGFFLSLIFIYYKNLLNKK